MLDPEVRLVLDRVPEFAGRYLTLVDGADGDPGAGAAFSELGELVCELAGRVEEVHPLLVRVLAAVEEVAVSSHDAEELIGGAFLDSLSPEQVRLLHPWLGPATRAAADGLDLPGAGPAFRLDDDGRDEGRP